MGKWHLTCKYKTKLSYEEKWVLIIYNITSCRRCSVKKVFLKISQNSQETTCARVSFLIKLLAPGLQFIKKETLAQAFFCESWEIFKNTFLYKTPPVAVSVIFIFVSRFRFVLSCLFDWSSSKFVREKK